MTGSLFDYVYVQGDPVADPGYYAVSIAARGCPASPYCSLYRITSSPAGDIVSNSWTYSFGPVYTDDPYYNLGKVLLFASGDGSAFPTYSVESYPCTAPSVTCVGGTSLYTTNALQRTSETGWAGAGGGCSAGEPIPAWQGHNGSGVCSPNRADYAPHPAGDEFHMATAYESGPRPPATKVGLVKFTLPRVVAFDQ